MRKAFVTIVLILLASSLFAQGAEWFKGSFEEAKAKAAAENKHVLIDFYSDG